MTNENNNENLVFDEKQINGTKYQIWNAKSEIDDICCVIVKIIGQQNFKIGQFKNIEIAKEVLEELDGNNYIGKKVRVKIKNHDKVYVGKVMSWTYGENSGIEICGGEENTNEKVYLIFNKFDDAGNHSIEKLEFIS